MASHPEMDGSGGGLEPATAPDAKKMNAHAAVIAPAKAPPLEIVVSKMSSSRSIRSSFDGKTYGRTTLQKKDQLFVVVETLLKFNGCEKAPPDFHGYLGDSPRGDQKSKAKAHKIPATWGLRLSNSSAHLVGADGGRYQPTGVGLEPDRLQTNVSTWVLDVPCKSPDEKKEKYLSLVFVVPKDFGVKAANLEFHGATVALSAVADR